MIREKINNSLTKIENKNDVALLFSGGVDSQTLLYSCIDIGIRPVLYTFYVNGYISEDLKYSRKIAEMYNLKLVEINIIFDKEQLIKDIIYLKNKFGMKLKTQIQCTQPFLYIIPNINEGVVLSGLCADELYGTPRSISKYAKDNSKFHELRNQKHKDIKGSSYIFIKTLIEDADKTFIAPYKENSDIAEYLLSRDFKTINSPKQKQIVLNEYPEILENKTYRRNSNLQCNSMLREYHSELLEVADKSIISEYNKIK